MKKLQKGAWPQKLVSPAKAARACFRRFFAAHTPSPKPTRQAWNVNSPEHARQARNVKSPKPAQNPRTQQVSSLKRIEKECTGQ